MPAGKLKEKTRDTKAIFAELKTSEKGLGSENAAKRLRIYGSNEIAEKKRISAFAIFAGQFRSVLIVLLVLAAAFAAFIGDFIDSSVILAIVIANAALGFRQEFKAEHALEALKRMSAPRAVVIRDGRRMEIETRDIVPGDIALLEEGTRIPADMVLVSSVNLKVNEASLTGESDDVAKAENSEVYAGTVVTYGRATAVVTKTGMQTEIGRIARVLQDEKDEETPLQKKLDAFGRRIGAIVVLISIFVIAAGLFRGGEIVGMVKFGIALAVAVVPEGLPAIVTITMAFGMQRMARKRSIVRKLTAVEALGSTTFICADKTGTITKNEMTVTRIYAGKEFEVTGHGYSGDGMFRLGSEKIEPLMHEHLMQALKIAALCNNAYFEDGGKENIMGDSTEVALLVAASKAAKLSHYSEKRIGEIPFSSERKMMSTLNERGSRARLYVKGAPEVVLEKCSSMLRNGKIVRITASDKKRILGISESFAADALRVLCMAYRDIGAGEIPKSIGESMEKELVFVGLAGMIDPPRESVQEDIRICREAGIRVAMITGDHANTAQAIAKQIGIPSGHVITGEELEKMSAAQLENAVEKIRVYARVNPIQKVRIVDALKKKGHIVAMTGDGVNDAPALKRADVGVAMGIKGTDVAKEASDMVLGDDNFSTIVAAVKEGRTIYNNIRNFIIYLLSSNIGEVLLIAAAMFLLGPEFLPVTAVQLLWINLVTDGLPATALGLDPAPPGIMKTRPRSPGERILSKSVLKNVFLVGMLMAAASLLLFFMNIGTSLAHAQTTAFTSLVVFEMVRVYSVRMKSRLSFSSNKKLLAAVAASLLLQLLLVYAQPFQIAFGTTALAPADWLFILAAAAALFAAIWIVGRKTG